MTEAERDAEFDKAIAPLSRQEFACLPHDLRKSAWDRYLARIDVLENTGRTDNTDNRETPKASKASKASKEATESAGASAEARNASYIQSFYRSTGPTPRCWKLGCEELCEINSWYCPDHTKREDVAPAAERVQWAKLGWRLLWLIIAAWILGFIIALTGVLK